MRVLLENMIRIYRIKTNMLQPKPRDVKIARRVLVLMQEVLHVHTQGRRHAQPVSICLANRAWHVTLGSTKTPRALKPAQVVLHTQIQTQMQLLPLRLVFAILDTLALTAERVQHVLLARTRRFLEALRAPIAARTRTRPLLALILFPLVKVVHQILNLETHQQP